LVVQNIQNLTYATGDNVDKEEKIVDFLFDGLKILLSAAFGGIGLILGNALISEDYTMEYALGFSLKLAIGAFVAVIVLLVGLIILMYNIEE